MLAFGLVRFPLHIVHQELTVKFGVEREEEREEAARMQLVLGWTQMQLGLSQEALEELKKEKAEVTVAKTDTEEKLKKSAAKVTVGCFRSLA